MQKLLVICGPTATGKTALGITLAKLLDGEIVSADSRQVYELMDIGTGKDIPVGSSLKRNGTSKLGFYEIEGIRVWGYDMVHPRRDFSVALYEKTVKKIIKQILKRGKLPIIVGGTGLYIKALVDGIPTASIPKNSRLRKSLEGKSASELYDILAQFDSIRAASLNQSDRSNPRRLIRAIEVADWKSKNRGLKPAIGPSWETLFIGLSAPRSYLDKQIDTRVKRRLKAGFLKEIESLLAAGVSWQDQAMASLGYRQLGKYFTGRETLPEVVSEWRKEEKAYARRQMTWFRKEKRINWFDISQEGWQKKVVSMAKTWHNMGYAKKN